MDGKLKSNFFTHILHNQTSKAMREEDDGPDGLIFLIPLIDQVLIERFGMILYIAFTLRTEEFHDVRIVSPLVNGLINGHS